MHQPNLRSVLPLSERGSASEARLPRPCQDDFSPALLAILNQLRLAALACRTSARTDLFEACAVLSTTPQIAKSAYIETLTRCLAQAMGQTPTLFRPGVAEVSFDEAWLLRAAEAVQNHDSNSFTFLIRSRIPPEHRRNLGYLIGTISEHFRLI